jgi:hypothetical protein
MIPGDGRFTYEGMSFSWRLKAEARHARGHQLYIRDTTILPSGGAAVEGGGGDRIAWSAWHGEKVIYRRLTPGRIDWSQLPELVVVLEPIFGERILHNAAARPELRTELDARARVSQVWRELYGHPPGSIRAGAGLLEVFSKSASTLRAAGREAEAASFKELAVKLEKVERGELGTAEALAAIRGARELLKVFAAAPGGNPAAAELRSLIPFALEGAGMGGFLWIDDPGLFETSTSTSTGAVRRVNRQAWRNGSSTRSSKRPTDAFLSADTLVVHVGDVGIGARELLPQSCIFDSQDFPQQPPYIWWNSPRDLTVSKGMHVSNQAFFLRRYARRVAGLWEKEYGHRPVVTAATAVSLNGRPPQALVDPEADLASVPVSWFGHNAWIRDLELPRIPRELLAEGSRRPPGFSDRSR